MKAITLHQPWASLVGLGIKTIETRSWCTKYRGPLAIHAAKRQPDQALRVGDFVTGWEYRPPSHPILWHIAPGQRWPWNEDRSELDLPRTDLPLGAVVAIAQLVDVIEISDGLTDFIYHRPGMRLWHRVDEGRRGTADMTDQLPYGNFTLGRYAWLLDNIKPIDPIPAQGRQGLWNWEDEHADR